MRLQQIVNLLCFVLVDGNQRDLLVVSVPKRNSRVPTSKLHFDVFLPVPFGFLHHELPDLGQPL